MVKFTTDKEINLTQLDNESGGQGLCINDNDPQNKIIATADGSTITQTQLETAISNHVAIFEILTIEQKLASVGLSIDDLKTALGL